MAEGTPIHNHAGPKGNIFVTYAREDERAVERLRTGLNRYVNVTWHAHLKFPELATERPQGMADAVRDCDILLSVFSSATAARGDDYSWLELIWVEMWKKISPEGKHYVAVLIDDSPEPARREAHSFPDVKYIRLPEGEVSPEFGAQIRGLLAEARATEEDNYATRMDAPMKDEPASPALSISVMKPQAPEKPLVHDENVQFTVYRPKTIVPRKWHTMLAFAHLSEKAPDAAPDDPDPLEEVARQARQVLGETDAYGQTTQDSSQAIPREGEITMVPVVEGIMFNPSRHSFLWTEAVHREAFRLRVANEMLPLPAVLRGRLTIYLGALIIAEIPLKFQAELEASPVPAQNMATTQARPYRKIFASYSHQDAPIVEHIEHYANAVGDTYLRDAVNLRSGQDWNAELMQMIEQADIFQLFWSSNSMRSKYCRQEWEYALGLNRPSFIRPTYWEDPLPSLPQESLPPPELSRLHFQKIMSSRLPVSGPESVPASIGAVRGPHPKSKAAKVGSGSSSIYERTFPSRDSRPPSSKSEHQYVKGESAMSMASLSPPQSSGRGGRKAGKIALVACVAVVAIGGFCFQYSRQNIMTAAAPSRQDAERQMEEALQKAQQDQETASAQKASSDVPPNAAGQDSAGTNSPNTSAAANFDASPSSQTQTADTASAPTSPPAGPNLTLTNAPPIADPALIPASPPSGTAPILLPASPPPTPAPAPSPPP